MTMPRIELESDVNLEGVEDTVQTPKPMCNNCDKFAVCYIWREIQAVQVKGFGLNVDPDKLPLDIFKLASLCNQYYPKKGF